MMETSLPQRLQQLERRIQELEAGERERASELVQSVLELHGAGLARLLELITHAGEPGQQILERLAQDDLVRNLLLLHGLQVLDLETRVGQALDQVRPFLHSQGAKVELLAIAEDAVRLRLVPGEDGYPASRQTLRAAIEEAIHGTAPDVHLIEFVDDPPRLPLPMLTVRERT